MATSAAARPDSLPLWIAAALHRLYILPNSSMIVAAYLIPWI